MQEQEICYDTEGPVSEPRKTGRKTKNFLYLYLYSELQTIGLNLTTETHTTIHLVNRRDSELKVKTLFLSLPITKQGTFQRFPNLYSQYIMTMLRTMKCLCLGIGTRLPTFYYRIQLLHTTTIIKITTRINRRNRRG